MDTNANYDNDRTIEVVNRAYKKMLERKARLGEPVYTDDGTGVMRVQRAIDVYERVYGPLPPLPDISPDLL
ncbi:MAG: hypothetical protein NC241_10480 [Bacteroides sp.]|nr:hypothetical protein [Bacteroides sp.]MCM1457184.1 hypothetical protein [Lachnoclostridium sp.]